MTEARVLEASRRALTQTEKRLIQARIRSLEARGRRASTGGLLIAGGLVFVLWLWTILASDAAWFIITAFWLVVGGGITAWVGRDIRRGRTHLAVMSESLASALRGNAADVYDVRARAFAELKEIEDEGACYAFELDDNRLVFIAGQQFYESARFPSLDFSLVYIVDEDGRTVDMLIEKRGARVPPARTIPAAVKRRLDVPDHLEVRTGRIEDLEAALGPSALGDP